MPYKNGYEFLEELKARRLGKHALKIALTNENQSGEMERTKELGADAHLIKAQYTPGEVVDQVASLLESR